VALLALNWNDVYTAGGFWVGVVSLVVGFIAFIIAIIQLRQARDAALASQTAAEAARDAAQKTLRESKDAFERFVAAHAGRILSELESAVGEANWEIAVLRARDMAEIIATLPAASSPTRDDKIAEAVNELREFGHTFTEFAEKEAKRLQPKVAKEQWQPLLERLHTRLDQLRAPFRETHDG
jgi:hypothetical protein